MDFTVAVLDFGTTALKSALFRLENSGRFAVVSEAVREFDYSYPEDGWIQFPVNKYVALTFSALKELIEKSPGTQLGAISVTGQAETLILVDHRGKPIGDAIVWLDNRAGKQAGKLREVIGDSSLYARTGLTAVDPILPLCKLPWIAENEPERYRMAAKALLLKDFIVFALTGAALTEYSVASCSGFFNILTKNWDDGLLDAAGVPRTLLPEILPPNAIAGLLKAEIRQDLGLSGEIPVLCGLLDQCASAIGCGNVLEGTICETTGTVLALAATTNGFEPRKAGFPVVCHGVPGKFLVLPYAPTAGMALKWFRHAFLSQNSPAGDYDEIDRKIIETTVPNRKMVMLPHFCGSVSPWSNPDATGVLYGLGLDTGMFDIARAILESVGFLLREILETLEEGGIRSARIISLGGGARSELWLQIKADITGRRLETMETAESTSIGCAMAAAETLGVADQDALKTNLRIARTFFPDDSKKRFYDEKFLLYKQLNRQLFHSCQ